MADKILHIRGLGGKKTLKGEVVISGAKNAVLPLFASALLFDDKVTFGNIPEIEDVHRMLELLEGIGVGYTKLKSNSYTLNTEKIKGTKLNHDIAKKLRASVILTGPMLSRLGKVSLPHPGGCVIGARPIDIFLDSFGKMGAKYKLVGDSYIITAPNRLTGAEIFLRVPSVTATETLMLAAVLAEGKTVIGNAAMEPEISDLAKFLNKCGANITGFGTTKIEIVGQREYLKSPAFVWTAIPDRIEAGSFLILGALCADDLLISECEPKHLGFTIASLIDAGVPIEVGKNYLRIKGNGRITNKKFKSFNLTTHVYPGFPTDLQAPMSVFLTQSTGEALVFETIFENRLNYVGDLVTMGAEIRALDAHRIIIKGGTSLKGRELYGPDLRAGLAFVIAALVACGESKIHNVYCIDRGYESIDEKLRSIGAKVERI